MVEGSKGIVVVQGDSYQKNLIVEDIDPITIDAIYISSRDLKISKQLVYDGDTHKYVFTLSPQETENLQSMSTTFDITIYFADGNVKTISYKARIEVLPKINKVTR